MAAVKLDENLSGAALALARQAGHDAESISSQRMNGSTDVTVFEHCRAEHRVLITLDLDFSNPLRFPPAGTAGTIILRPQRPSPGEIEALLDQVMRRLATESVQGTIWIVESGRVRIYRPWDIDGESG